MLALQCHDLTGYFPMWGSELDMLGLLLDAHLKQSACVKNIS